MISVVVPVYKVERFLPQCAESILSQSYTDIQLILVDDGSPDRCGAMCDEYARQDGRVTVIHRENGGLSAARNSGIEAAQGEYITFVDSDDFLLPGTLQDMVSLMEGESADVVVSKTVRCDENDTPDTFVLPAEKREIKLYTGGEIMRCLLIGRDIPVTAWGKLYKTKLFQGIRYPEGKEHEDVYTSYMLLHLARKVACTGSPGYVYRKNGGGQSLRFSEKRLASIDAKIQQAHFVEREYPNLKSLAYIGIVYACNRCLWQMSLTDYQDKVVLSRIQKLYREYGRYYLAGDVSVKGKIVTLAAMADIRLGRLICRTARAKEREAKTV